MGVLDSIEQKAYTLSPLCHIRNMQSKRSIAKQEQRLQSDVNDRELHGILECNEREQEQDSSARSSNGSTSTSDGNSTGTSTGTSDINSNSDVDVRRDSAVVDNVPGDVATTASTAAVAQPPTKTFEKVRGYHVGSGRAVNWTSEDSPQISATQQDKTSKTSDAKAGGSTHIEPAAAAARVDKPQPATSSHGSCQPSNTAETAGDENKRTRIRRYTFEWDYDVPRASVMSDSVARANTSPRAQKFLAAYYARQQQEQQQKEQQEREREREQKTQQEKPQALVRRSRFVESFKHTAAQTIARHNGEPTTGPSVIHDATCSGAQPTSTRKELKAKMESFATKLSRAMAPSKEERRKKQEQKDKDTFMSRYMGNGKEEYAAELARLIMGGAGGGGGGR